MQKVKEKSNWKGETIVEIEIERLKAFPGIVEIEIERLKAFPGIEEKELLRFWDIEKYRY